MRIKLSENKINLYFIFICKLSSGSTETDFKPQIEKLNRELFTIVAYDPRGYGRSRPPDRDFPIDFFHRDAEDAKDLMNVST